MCTKNRREETEWDTKYLSDILTSTNVVVRSAKANGKLMKQRKKYNRKWE